MARHFSEDWDNASTEDTDAQWAPMPDDVWALNETLLDPESDEEATSAAEDWLTPAATMVRPRVAGPVPRPGDTAAVPYAPAPHVEAPEPAASERRSMGAEPVSEGPSFPDSAPKHAWKPARHGCLSVFLWLIMLGVLGMMALRCLPSELANGRLVPEAVSFVPWLFAPIAVCLALAALWRRRLLLVVCVCALGVMGWWHRGYFLPTARVSDSAAATVRAGASADDSAARVMTLNCNHGGASAADVVALVRAQNVEVLCLQELTDGFLDELAAAGIYDVLPYCVISDEASAISNGGRNGIWTLAPMENVSSNLLPIDTSSMPAATVWIGGQAVRVVAVHPNSPVRGAQDLWDEGLSVIGSLAGYDHAYVIMGDFNSTWDHARFRELLGSSFVDAGEQSGEGFHMTYPSDGLPSLVEIDHIVYARDSGIVVSSLVAVEVSGTDHRALLGTLEVTG